MASKTQWVHPTLGHEHSLSLLKFFRLSAGVPASRLWLVPALASVERQTGSDSERNQTYVTLNCHDTFWMYSVNHTIEWVKAAVLLNSCRSEVREKKTSRNIIKWSTRNDYRAPYLNEFFVQKSKLNHAWNCIYEMILQILWKKTLTGHCATWNMLLLQNMLMELRSRIRIIWSAIQLQQHQLQTKVEVIWFTCPKPDPTRPKWLQYLHFHCRIQMLRNWQRWPLYLVSLASFYYHSKKKAVILEKHEEIPSYLQLLDYLSILQLRYEPKFFKKQKKSKCRN